MVSPACEVKDGSGSYTATTSGVDVTPNNTITIRLASATGVDTWSLTCIGTDENSTAASINSGLSINSTTKTATFTMPNATGRALIFQSKVNNGRDVNGTTQSSYTTTFAVYTLTAASLRVVAVNETTESSATFGWIKQLNAKIRQTSGGSTPTGTGFRHVTSGTEDAAAALVVNADVNAAAAIAGTKISPDFGSQNVVTSGSITGGSMRDTALGTGLVHSDSSGNFTSSTLVNADVNASAAVAGTKISPNFGAQAVSTTGSGTFAGLITTKGFRVTVRTVTSTPATVTSDDFHIAVTASAAFAVNLPTGSSTPTPTAGDTYEVSDYGGNCATYNITVDAGTGNTIDGSQTYVMSVNNSTVTVRCIATSPSYKWKLV